MNDSPVTSPNPHDPSLDQAVALHAAATRLEAEFEGRIDDDAIEQFLRSAYDHVAEDATIDNFLPLLAERYTREWLSALVEQQSGAG
ncbi:hypothetical protein DFR70_11420 [Nocardia tenerifensis]|uniref:Protein-tyrosine-phosphatase-like N-terminal domain-containing protein n=1 Tax=Nocardia tenerifensis TaxID=228006 RepID=A0A318K5H2_9NOCA|nr:hypothetical protein [Nocardia tenerifensis]PXX58338.1 hypothetical protein DFR70_11420 [Nocardia tenerifensis]